MIALTSIRTSSPPSTRCSHRQLRRRKTWRSPARARGAGDDRSWAAPPPGGDKRKQELLAMIAMLQAKKVRVAEFLDERSAYLTQSAEDANTEFDEIARGALQELEDAGARIMEKLDGRTEDFEAAAEISRQEIEDNERMLMELEDKIERDRNEGLFFKSLGKPTTSRRVAEVEFGSASAEEAEKLRDAARASAALKLRRNGYLALMSVVAVSIVGAVAASSEVDWRRVGALGLILVGLAAQLVYEQSASPSTEKDGNGKK